jgi:PRTRC genetic system protein C
MALEATKMDREFSFNGVKLQDINPTFTPEQIREAYLSKFPELATATIEGPEVTSSGTRKYTFRNAIGSKG